MNKIPEQGKLNSNNICISCQLECLKCAYIIILKIKIYNNKSKN